MTITKATLIATICLLMTSCYSSQINVGNMPVDHPVKTVATKKNHYLLGGLVPISRKQVAKDYVGDAKHYRVRTSHKFVDVLISSVTIGLYTPITVTYYMSEFETNKKYQKEYDTFDLDEMEDLEEYTPTARSIQNQMPKEKEKPAEKKKKKEQAQPAPQKVKSKPQPAPEEPISSVEQLRRQIEQERLEHERRMRGMQQ